MKRIFSIIAAATLAFASPAAWAQELSLSQISSYLNRLDTAQGGFTQINSDGSLITGTLYIKRPGRIRFEYDPPERSMVIAGGGQVAIFDPRSNAEPDRYPLNQTPLNLILQRNVDLSRANMVTDKSYDGTSTKVRMQDPENPDYGTIELVFTGNPTELRQWIVTDEQGSQTTMVLNDLERGGSLGDILFNIRAEMRNWGN